MSSQLAHLEGHEGVLELFNRGKAQSVTENWHYDSTFFAKPPAKSPGPEPDAVRLDGWPLTGRLHTVHGLSKLPPNCGCERSRQSGASALGRPSRVQVRSGAVITPDADIAARAANLVDHYLYALTAPLTHSVRPITLGRVNHVSGSEFDERRRLLGRASCR